MPCFADTKNLQKETSIFRKMAGFNETLKYTPNPQRTQRLRGTFQRSRGRFDGEVVQLALLAGQVVGQNSNSVIHSSLYLNWKGMRKSLPVPEG